MRPLQAASSSSVQDLRGGRDASLLELETPSKPELAPPHLELEPNLVNKVFNRQATMGLDGPAAHAQAAASQKMQNEAESKLIESTRHARNMSTFTASPSSPRKKAEVSTSNTKKLSIGQQDFASKNRDPRKSRKLKVDLGIDETLYRGPLKTPVEIPLSAEMQQQAVYFKVERLVEVFEMDAGEEDDSIIDITAILPPRKFSVDSFKRVVEQEFETIFATKEVEQLFKHILLVKDINAATASIPPKVSGNHLVDYFCKGLKVGIGKNRIQFGQRSALHTSICYLLDNLDHYANVRAYDIMSEGGPPHIYEGQSKTEGLVTHESVGSKMQILSGKILFSAPASCTVEFEDEYFAEKKKCFVVVTPHKGLVCFTSEEDFQSLRDAQSGGGVLDASALDMDIFERIRIYETPENIPGVGTNTSSLISVNVSRCNRSKRVSQVLDRYFQGLGHIASIQVSNAGPLLKEKSKRCEALHFEFQDKGSCGSFMIAAGMVQACKIYRRACWAVGVPGNPSWVNSLNNGAISDLVISSNGIFSARDSQGSIGALLKSLQLLKKIQMMVNQCDALPRNEAENQMKIERLYVQNEDITGRLADKGNARILANIIETIKSSLKVLDIRGCNFDSSTSLFVVLKPYFSSSRVNLKSLTISRCGLDEFIGVAAFETVFSGLKSSEHSFIFEKVDLSDNHNLPGDKLASILECFPSGSIKHLNLSGTSIEDSQSVVTAIWRQKGSLQFLNLSSSAASSSVLASLVGALSTSNASPRRISNGGLTYTAHSGSRSSNLRELDIRGNYLDVQVIAIILNALQSNTNSLEVAHMGGSAPENVLMPFISQRKLVDLADVQNHLTHHRYGKTSYYVGKLSLTRKPFTSSTMSPPCRAMVQISALLESFEPASFALELSKVLGVPSRHFHVQVQHTKSLDGHLSLMLEVSGVPSLSLGDVNANRSIVSKLVSLVTSMDPEAWRLRIIRMTMIKKEMVSIEEKNPKITDNFSGPIYRPEPNVSSSARLMKRLESFDKSWMKMLISLDKHAAQTNYENNSNHEEETVLDLEAELSKTYDEIMYSKELHNSESDYNHLDRCQDVSSVNETGGKRQALDQTSGLSMIHSTLFATKAKGLVKQLRRRHDNSLLDTDRMSSVGSDSDSYSGNISSGSSGSSDDSEDSDNIDDNIDMTEPSPRKMSMLDVISKSRTSNLNKDKVQSSKSKLQQIARRSSAAAINVDAMTVRWSAKEKKVEPEKTKKLGMSLTTDVLPDSTRRNKGNEESISESKAELKTEPEKANSNKPFAGTIARVACAPHELVEVRGGGILPLPKDVTRLYLYQCLRMRNRQALKDILYGPGEAKDMLDMWEIAACASILNKYTEALTELANAMARHSSIIFAMDDGEELRAFISRLEAACVSCAEAGIDAETVIPMREALSDLAIAYGRCRDSGSQQMNRHILGAMFTRDAKTLRQVISRCERIGNLPAPEHARMFIDAAKRQLKGMVDAQKGLEKVLKEASSVKESEHGVAVKHRDVGGEIAQKSQSVDEAQVISANNEKQRSDGYYGRLQDQGETSSALRWRQWQANILDVHEESSLKFRIALLKSACAQLPENNEAVQNAMSILLHSSSESHVMALSYALTCQFERHKKLKEKIGIEETRASIKDLHQVCENAINSQHSRPAESSAPWKSVKNFFAAQKSAIQDSHHTEVNSPTYSQAELPNTNGMLNVRLSISESIQSHATKIQSQDPLDLAIHKLCLSVHTDINDTTNSNKVHASQTNPVATIHESMQILQSRATSLSPLRQVQLISNIISWSLQSNYFSRGDHTPLFRAVDQARTNEWATNSTIFQQSLCAIAYHEAIQSSVFRQQGTTSLSCITAILAKAQNPLIQFHPCNWPYLKGHKTLSLRTRMRKMSYEHYSSGKVDDRRVNFRPLTSLPNTVKALACKVFRLLQNAIEPGSRSGPGGKFSAMRLWLDALRRATPALLIEAYLQLMKQLHCNPSPSSTLKGWECLLALIYIHAYPSQFAPYLHTWLVGYWESATSVEEGPPSYKRPVARAVAIANRSSAQHKTANTKIVRARRLCTALVRSGELVLVRNRRPGIFLPRRHSVKIQSSEKLSSSIAHSKYCVPSEKTMFTIYAQREDHMNDTSHVRVVIPGHEAIEVEVLPFTSAGDVIATAIKVLTKQSGNLSAGHLLWEDFSLYLTQPLHSERQHLMTHEFRNYERGPRIGNSEDLRWSLTHYFNNAALVRNSKADKMSSRKYLKWTVLMYPNTRLRCGHIAKDLASSALGEIYFQLACNDIRSGRFRCDLDLLAYALTLYVRTMPSFPLRAVAQSEWLGMLRSAAATILPQNMHIQAPSELKYVMKAACVYLGSMPSGNDSADRRIRGVNYYRYAFIGFVKLWNEFGSTIFESVGLAGYEAQENSGKKWLPPTSGLNNNAKDARRDTGNRRLTLIICQNCCKIFSDFDSKLTSKSVWSNLIPVETFTWDEVVQIKMSGMAHSNIDIDLGEMRGRIVIRCFTAGRASEILFSMQDQIVSLLRQGRGVDDSAEMVSWWHKFTFGDLPPCTASCMLPQHKNGLNRDKAIDCLVNIVLHQAQEKHIVYAQLLSDLDSICFRVVGNTTESSSINSKMSNQEDSLTEAAQKISSLDFAKVLKYLNVLPETVSPAHIEEVLHSASITHIDNESFCQKICRILETR